MDHMLVYGIIGGASPDLWSLECRARIENNTQQNMDKGHQNIESPSLYIPWNNSVLEKNLMQNWESNLGPLDQYTVMLP